ncbi:hypothetical protein D3C72_809850 [compost metagenome]
MSVTDTTPPARVAVRPLVLLSPVMAMVSPSTSTSLRSSTHSGIAKDPVATLVITVSLLTAGWSLTATTLTVVRAIWLERKPSLTVTSMIRSTVPGFCEVLRNSTA